LQQISTKDYDIVKLAQRFVLTITVRLSADSSRSFLN